MEPFIGQIQCFAFDFAPRGWAKCEGQILQIAANSALFSLLGTTYGGDGRTTFALPDLRGRVLMGDGAGAGLAPRKLGEKAGSESVTLSETQIPSHNHAPKFRISQNAADSEKPSGSTAIGSGKFYVAAAANTELIDSSVTSTSVGGGQSHNNMQPSIAMSYCIAINGVFPSRS